MPNNASLTFHRCPKIDCKKSTILWTIFTNTASFSEHRSPLSHSLITFSRSPDRMANYERIFLNTIKKQTPKFEGQNPPEQTNKLITLKRSNTDGGQWTNVGGGKYTRDTKPYHALDSSDEDEDPE